MFLEQLEQRSLLAVLVWDGSANNLWSNPANWAGDVAPIAGDDLVFPDGAGSLANLNDLAAGTRFNTILIQGSGYNITGAAIELNGGLTANNATGSNTFGLDTTLLNAQSIMSANPGTTLNYSGAIHTGVLIGTSQIFGTSALFFDGAGTTNVTGVIGGSGSVTKLGNGSLILSGANTYEGITDVRQGVIVVNNNAALGSATTGDTQIQQGAALHIQGGRTIAENFAIREGGIGFGDGIDGSTLGALRGTGGVNTITGNIDLATANNLIGVDGGSTLVVSGVVASALGGTNRLIKVGDGTLQLAGTADNVYRGETRVLKGTLELNKTAGRNAIGGDLLIGDNIGGDNGATVRLLANNQIPHLNFFEAALTTITLNSSGLLDFAGNSDTVGNLILTTGTTYSADIDLNGGTLTLGGASLTLNGFQGSSGASPAATIQDGTFNVGTFFSGTGGGLTKSFIINDSQLANIATDLNISASLAGPSDVSITRTGGGTLQFGGPASTFAGPFVWNGGIIEIATNNALGTGLISAQNDGNTFKAIGNRTLGNPLSLDANNTNFIGSDNLTFTGNVTLTTVGSSRTLRVMDPAQTVTITGVIGESIFGSQQFFKGGRGTLALEGANTYSGTTTINNDGGTLVLRGNGTILNSSGVTVGIGGVFKIDNDTAVAGGANLTDRINDAAVISLSGKLQFVSDSAGNSSELVGTLTPNGSLGTTIELVKTSPAAFSSAFTTTLLAQGTDRTVNFIGTGTALSDSAAPGANRFSSVNNPGGLDDGILPMGLVVGPAGQLDFATYGSSPEGFAIIPLPASAYVTDLTLAGPTSNVRLAADVDLSTSKSINSLLLEPGVNVTGAGATLTIVAHRTVLTDGSSIEVTNLNTSNGLITVPSGTATIASNIFSGIIQKGGRGELVLSGENQTASAINVNEGILEVRSNTALGSPVGTTTVRQGATLALNGNLDIGLEPLSISGAGFSPNAPGSGLDTYASATGALRLLAGNANYAGTVTLGGDPTDLTGMTDGFPVIVNSTAFVNIATGSQFTLTGDLPGAVDMVKSGGGTFELAGIINRAQDRNNRIFEGTMLLNNEPGVIAQRGRFLVGTDAPGAPAATLRLGSSDQINDDRSVQVFSSGLFDLNGNSDVIAEGGLTLHIGPNGAGDVNIGAGGVLTVNAGTQVFTIGTGNPTGATITGGEFALQVFGVISTPGTRTIQVNDGAVGDDLTITSVISDGTGLQSVGLVKNGFGTLVLGGTTPNTMTGVTTINEGTLALNKTAGVTALQGTITIGNNDVTSGFAGSDVLELRQSNQIADFMSGVMTFATTGKLVLNGNDETFGLTDGQVAISMQAGSAIELGGGTLSIIGNLNSNAANGAGLWTPTTPTRISGGTLNLGNIARGIDLGGDRTELPYELEISADIVGAAGFFITNSATILLSGDNSGLSGDILRTNGNFAIGSDTAFGTGRVMMSNVNQVASHLVTYGGKRTIANRVDLVGTIAFVGGNGLAVAGIQSLGGGGNDLAFTGPVNLINGGITAVIVTAAQVDFGGGLGETLGGAAFNKSGYGTAIISSNSSYSGSSTINTNGGALILRDQGTSLNNSFTVNIGGTLQIDNRTGANLTNRLGDLAQITMTGGTLSLVGSSGAITTESIGQLFFSDNTTSQVQLLLSPFGGSTATWRFTNYGRTANGGALANFMGRGVDIGATTANKLLFNAAPGLVNSILPTAIITNTTGVEFASVRNPLSAGVSPYFNALEPYTAVTAPLIGGVGVFATTLTGATAATNVRLTGNESLAANTSASAVLLANGGITISESAASTLTLSSGLLASFGTGNALTTTGLTLTPAESLIVNAGDLTINSLIAGAATTLAKNGPGLLTVGGPGGNSFTGLTRVNQGIYRAAKPTAFGTTGGNVNVAYGGTVELTGGIVVPAETITINGNGEANVASVPLRNLSGTNTWLGNVVLNSNRTGIVTEAGSTLVLSGVVSGNSFNKIGAGTMQFAGTAANTYANNQLSIIWQGVLELNKTGVNAINSQLAIGDYVGASGADVLRLLQSNQMADNGNPTLRINSTGLFDLNNNSETFAPGATVNSLELWIGAQSSAAITTGTGTLTLGSTGAFASNINTGVLNGGFPSPITIAGNLALTAGAAQTAALNDGAGINDIVISAVISGANALTKTGNGRLILSGDNNAFAGSLTISGGEVVVSHPNALGTTGGNTVVGSGFSLLIDGVSSAEPLNVNGVGFGGQGAVRSLTGANNWSGDVTLAGSTTISVDSSANPAHRLILSGAVTMGANSFTKLMPGVLQFAGATPNTGTGLTIIMEGTLELNKTPGVNAIPFRVEVGNSGGAAGGPDADVMRWLASDQIADGSGVANSLLVIEASGLADMNGFNETIMGPAAVNGVFTRWSTTQSGRLDLRGGNLTLGNGVIANGTMGGAAAGGVLFTINSPPGRFDDSVGTGLITLAPNNGAWDFPDVAVMPIEVQVNARIANSGTGRILKTGTSTLALAGNNSTTLVAHTTTLGGGALVVRDGNALGDAASTLNVTAATALLPLPGGPALVDGHNITLNSNLVVRGDANVTLNGSITNSVANRILDLNVNAGNSVTLGGTINLAEPTAAAVRTLTVNNNTFGGGVINGLTGGDVTISGQIVNGSPLAGGFTKGGVGLLTLSNNTNSYTGTTLVTAGSMRVAAEGALGGKIAEQQSFGVTSTGGGSFTITYLAATAALPFVGTVPPSATDVANALNALPAVARTGGVVSVTSSNPAGPTTTYTLTFGGTLEGVDVTQVTVAVTAPVTLSTAVATPVNGSGFTTVNAGSTLQVVGGLTMTEPLDLGSTAASGANSLGFGNFGTLRLVDLNPGATETTTWAVPLRYGTTLGGQQTWFGVDGGGANPDRLILAGTVGSASGSLGVKVGAGEFEFGGMTDNGQVSWNGVSPLDDGFEIRQGTVLFNKPQVSGINYNAIVGAGTVTVGDGGGGGNIDRLILTGTSLDQIGGTAPVAVGPSGHFTMAGTPLTEAIPGVLTLQRLAGLAGILDSSPTRTFTLGNNVAVTNIGVTTGATPAAMILGNLALGATRNFDVNDSFVLNPADDLVVPGIISGTGFGVTKQLSGTMALTSGNTYTGTTTVNATTLDFNASFAKGLDFVVAGTLVARNAGNFGTGPVTVNGGATLVLDNTVANANRIADGVALTSASGNLVLIGNAAGSTEVVGTLALNNNDSFGQGNRVTIDSTAGGVTMLQATTLSRGGSASAEFIGVGADLGSATNSRIQITGANPLVNNVLPWATVTGPAGFDLVTDTDGTPLAAPYFLGRVPVYSTDINAQGIVRLSGGTHTLTADRTVDALLLENGAMVDGPFMLTIGTATAGLVVTNTGSNTIATTGSAVNPGVQFATREPLFLTEGTSSLTVSSNINSTNTLRKERTGTLILSGDNDDVAGRQLTGATVINVGTLIVRNSDALGTEPGGTVTVLRRAALVLDSTAGALTFGNKPMNINGLGLNDDGSGALRTIGPNLISIGTGATAFNWNMNPTFVHVGAGSTLSLNALVGGGGNPLTKRGTGELIYTGASGNTNTGQVSVNEGTLSLDKSGAVIAVNGAIVVDDLGNYDGIGGGTVRYTGASTDMIGNVAVTVNYPGVFDINGRTDATTGALTVQGGTYQNTAGGGAFQVNALTMTGGLVDTGTGSLNLNGTFTFNNGLTTSGPATIAGNLNLLGAARAFAINDGREVNDVVINAIISNGGVTKTNVAGALLLDPAGGINTYAGNTILQGGILALGSKDALGTGTLTLNTAGSTLRPKAGVNLSGANAIANTFINSLVATNQFTLGGRRDVSGTNDIELSGTHTFPNLDFTYRVDDPLVNAEISGVIGGGGAAAIFRKDGIGTLELSGNNTFTVVPTAIVGGNPVTIGQAAGFSFQGGALRVSHSNALGAGPTANANVRGDLGAVLEIDGSAGAINLVGRNLIVFNPDNSIARGLYNRTSTGAAFTGTVRSLAGANTVTGQIDLRNIADNANAGTNYIGVDSGSLEFIGQVIGSENDAATTVANNRNLLKVGSGTLRYSGAANNTITGTTTILDGTLELNKTAGINAIAGPLQVADNFATASVLWLANEQVVAGQAITVASTGTLNLNDFTETTSVVATLTVGPVTSSQVSTGASGNWIHPDAVTVVVRPGVTAAAPPVTISGHVQLTTTAAGVRTYTVNDGPGENELVVSANFTEAATFAGGLTKAGAGRMSMTSADASTYTGNVLISGGVLRIHADGDLGTNAGTTTVNGGTSLELTGGFTETGESLVLNGTGIINGAVAHIFNNSVQGAVGTGALRNVGGSNVWQGNVSIANNPTGIAVDAGDLTFSGTSAMTGAGALLKLGTGVLELGGTVNNAYTSNTYINQGTLRLNKQGTAVAIDNGEIFLGDNIGADNADVLIYAATAGTNQIGDQTIRIAATGLWDLNGVSDANNPGSFLDVGSTMSANIVTGAGVLSISNTGTIFTVVNQAGTSSSSPAAAISGNLSLVNNEIQTVTVPATVTTFTLTFAGVPTANITRATDTGAAVQAALELLPGIGVGNVSVAGAAGGPYTITFINARGNQDLAQLTAAVTAGTGTVAIVTNANGGGSTIDVRKSGLAPVELAIPAVIQHLFGTTTLTKVGRGTLELSGNNTYTGTTTLGADVGTLLANTPATVAASPYSVGAGSTLGGSGTITGAVTLGAVASNLTSGGILNPGPSGLAPNNTGILTVNNNVIFSAGSLYAADINGTVAGADYDQLVVGGTGTVTITGVAGPTQSNTAMINGTTGNGFQPVNGVDAFRLINKTSAGAITGPPVGSFLSQILPQPPQSSPSTVLLGGKTYSTTYNVAAGLNDGNDFVLEAVTTTRVWDGEGNLLIGPNSNWSLGFNWVGDFAPFSGDSVLFGDQGNTREANFNDFVGFSLGAITLNKTLGAPYTLNGNAVTLSTLGSGITQTGPTVTSNVVNLAGLTLATNPQTITNASMSNLLTINSPINGGQILNLAGLGDLTFNGAIGGVTPVASIAVDVGVDDLTFSSTIATTGNVTQTAGAGQTTLSGGSVGGTLTMTTENFVLAGGTLNVVGAATLTATVGSIADGNAAANNLTAPSLTATAVTGIDLDTTIVDLTATNSGAGNVTIEEANGLNILGLSVANGNAVITALGALTDGATAVTSVSGNGSFSGTTITLGEAAGDTFDVGTLTFNSAGAVNINENSSTQLVGTNTAISLLLGSTAAITNAAAASLAVTNNGAFSGTSVTLGNQAGDAINLGSLTFTSAGAVNIAEDSVTNLAGTSTADSLVLSSTGITNNAAASVTVTNNATLTAQGIVLGSAAGDTINFGTVTFTTTVAGIDLTEDSAIDLLGVNLAAGPVILTSPDQAAAGQNITLPLGSSVTSTLSSITLTAGDNVTLAGNVSAATTLNVVVDNSAVDPGVGGNVTVTGTVTAAGGAFFTGNADNDTFTLTPQATAAFTVNGNAPTASPGDVLNLDLSATVNPVLTLGGLGSGTWTFDPPLLPVTYISIEQVTSTGANYNLVLNANTSGFGNTGVDDEILLRRSGADFIVERTGQATAPDNDDVGVIFQGAMANILSFNYIGSSDNDIVTVSDAGGLFEFSSSVPGVPNNPNLAGTAEFSFNGNAGNDRLVFSLIGASAANTYAMGSGSGAPGAEGEIETVSGGVTLLTYFQNVELAQRMGSGATPGELSVLGDLSPNAMSVVANGTATQVTATGYTPFEFTGNNYSGVSVSGGLNADTLELLSIGMGQTNPLATTLNGDAGADTLRVHSTSGNTGVVTLNGGLGNDSFQLYDSGNTVNNITGPVVVDGTDGNVGGNTDTLTIIDSGDLSADTVFVNPVNPGVSADYRVEGITSAAGDDVTFRNVDVLDYTGTQGNDTIDARFATTVPVQDLSIVTLNGWLGADQFLLFTSDQAGGSGPGNTPTGTPSGVAVVNLNGDAPGNPNLTDGNDVFGETPPGLTGTGASDVGLIVPDTVRAIRPSASTGINIDGGQPTGPAVPTGDTIGDVFNLDISGLPPNSALILPTVSGVVAAGGLQPLAYTQIEDINVILNNQLINVQMGDTLVRGTAGADLIQFMRNATPMNPNLARVRVNAQVVDLTLTGKTLTFGGPGNDYITQANVNLPAEIYGEDGDDYISGAMANDFLVGGLGFDQINASGGDNVVWGDNAPSTAEPNPQDLAIGGDDILSGLGGNDVFYGGGGNDSISAGGGNDYANGGQGDDTIGGGDGDDRLYGGAGNDVLGGGAGNDLLSGGSGNDSLTGNTGADVIFGGTGVDTLNGDAGNDLLVTGSVFNENSSRTSVASVGNFNAAVYSNGSDNDAALLSLLTQWAMLGDRSSIAPITHDGVKDNVFGFTGDDDFCWEAADVNLPAVAPPDFNGIGMGADDRFGPT